MSVIRFPAVQRKALDGHDIQHWEDDGRLHIHLGKDLTRVEEDRAIRTIVWARGRLAAIPLVIGMSAGRATEPIRRHKGASAAIGAGLIVSTGAAWLAMHPAGDHLPNSAQRPRETTPAPRTVPRVSPRAHPTSPDSPGRPRTPTASRAPASLAPPQPHDDGSPGRSSRAPAAAPLPHEPLPDGSPPRTPRPTPPSTCHLRVSASVNGFTIVICV